MISADEALEISEKNNDYILKKQLSEIERAVIEHSNQGNFEVYLHEDHFNQARETLEKLGYRFKSAPHWGNNWFTMEWSRISKLEKTLK